MQEVCPWLYLYVALLGASVAAGALIRTHAVGMICRGELFLLR
jgi:hypothetical protein